MGASWTRSSRRSGCSAFAEQELARAVRRFGGSYELSAPTRFLEGGGPAVQAVVPARGSRLERELGLRRAAFTCASVSVSQASTSSESKGPRRLLAAARRQRPPRKRGVWTTRATAPARERRRLSQAPRPRLHRLDELGRRDMRQVAARRRQARVPELRLDQVHGLPLERELRGVRVAQPVGVNMLLDPGAPCRLSRRRQRAFGTL